MSRHLKVAAAQLGPIRLADSKASAVKRMMAMLREAERHFLSINKIFADAARQGAAVAHVVADTGRCQLDIVKRSEPPKLLVLPKCWIVKRNPAPFY